MGHEGGNGERTIKRRFEGDGTGEDGSIKHTGSNLQIFETTGGLQITNYANDQDVDIRTDDGSGGTSLYFRADGSTGEAILYNYGSEKLKTTSSGASVTGDLTLTDTTADSAAGPELLLYRNSSSPADADYLGQIKFQGENDNDEQINYAKITGKILDASDGSEDGILEFAHIKAGSQTITGRWRSDSLQLLNSTNLSVAGRTAGPADPDCCLGSGLAAAGSDRSGCYHSGPGTLGLPVVHSVLHLAAGLGRCLAGWIVLHLADRCLADRLDRIGNLGSDLGPVGHLGLGLGRFDLDLDRSDLDLDLDLDLGLDLGLDPGLDLGLDLGLVPDLVLDLVLEIGRASCRERV